jgi:hypothetical protein
MDDKLGFPKIDAKKIAALYRELERKWDASGHRDFNALGMMLNFLRMQVLDPQYLKLFEALDQLIDQLITEMRRPRPGQTMAQLEARFRSDQAYERYKELRREGLGKDAAINRVNDERGEGTLDRTKIKNLQNRSPRRRSKRRLPGPGPG